MITYGDIQLCEPAFHPCWLLDGVMYGQQAGIDKYLGKEWRGTYEGEPSNFMLVLNNYDDLEQINVGTSIVIGTDYTIFPVDEMNSLKILGSSHGIMLDTLVKGEMGLVRLYDSGMTITPKIRNGEDGRFSGWIQNLKEVVGWKPLEAK